MYRDDRFAAPGGTNYVDNISNQPNKSEKNTLF